MGLIVSVLKQDGEREERTLVVDLTAPAAAGVLRGPSDPTPERPAVLIDFGPMRRPAVFDADPELAARGIYRRERRTDCVGPMANGRFVWTSDSRFLSELPLRYFDRWETPAQYASHD